MTPRKLNSVQIYTLKRAMYDTGPVVKPYVPSRNKPCPCGSGVKYKKCCLPKEREEEKKIREENAKKKSEEQQRKDSEGSAD